MTTIKTTLTLDDSTCVLTLNDITGFYNSGTNTTGFLTEADSSTLALNMYKLSHGYFFNVLLANKYASTSSVSNTTESLYKVSSVNATYANNFTPSTYTLSTDGTFIMQRYFIPSLAFYTANHTNGIYSGKDMYYTDGTSIYKVISGTPTIVATADFVTNSFANSDVIVTNTSFISTCKTNNCYFAILSTLLNMDITDCVNDNKYDELVVKRDLVYMTLEVIKYLQADNNITQIQKLIEALDVCGLLCASLLNPLSPSRNNNCGCNG